MRTALTALHRVQPPYGHNACPCCILIVRHVFLADKRGGSPHHRPQSTSTTREHNPKTIRRALETRSPSSFAGRETSSSFPQQRFFRNSEKPRTIRRPPTRFCRLRATGSCPVRPSLSGSKTRRAC